MGKIQEIFKVQIAYKTTILLVRNKSIKYSEVCKTKTKNLKIIRVLLIFQYKTNQKASLKLIKVYKLKKLKLKIKA
jgi:hypothetical protein